MPSATQQAVSQPQFIIKLNDNTYFLTVSLWTYDRTAAAAPGLSAAGQAALANSFATIENSFNANLAAHQVVAVEVPGHTPINYAAMAT
jgi:hypothetical protein